MAELGQGFLHVSVPNRGPRLIGSAGGQPLAYCPSWQHLYLLMLCWVTTGYFCCTMSNEAPAAAAGVSSHDAAASLLGCPCRLSAVSRAPATLNLTSLGLSLQGFLQLRYQQSPLKSVEPATLSLTIAPIDVIYSQLCLLRLVNFLNAAWPPPNLVSQTLQIIPFLCGK